MKRLGWIVLIIFLGFGAYGAYRVLFPPRVGGIPFSDLPAEAQQKRREEAQELVKDVEDVARSARNRERKTFTLTATEDQLNTLLQDRIRTNNFPVKNLRAGLTPGTLTLQGDAEWKGYSAPATGTGTLEAREGALVFTIQSLNMGIISAPDDIKEKAQKSISEMLEKAFRQEKGAYIDKVTVDTGKLTVEGHTG